MPSGVGQQRQPRPQRQADEQQDSTAECRPRATAMLAGGVRAGLGEQAMRGVAGEDGAERANQEGGVGRAPVEVYAGTSA